MNKLLVPLTVVSLMLAACGRDAAVEDVATAPSTPPRPEETSPATTPSPVAGATVALSPTQGRQAAGRLLFTQENDGVRIRGDVTGLKPGSEHGFHVHETGDCTAPDASSAGEHFNPTGKMHGNPAAEPHHSGDLFNLRADAGGTATVDIVAPSLTVGGDGVTNVVGKAVIVHEAADDYISQASGNSGERIACGVVG